MGWELNRAFAKRQIGDYTHTFVISEGEAELLLKNGKLAEITRYLKENKDL
jgi:hypothetical protein